MDIMVDLTVLIDASLGKYGQRLGERYKKIGGEDSNNNFRFDSFITECNCGKFCKWTSGKPFCYDPNEYDYSVYHYDSDYDQTYESEIDTIPEAPVLLPDAVDTFLTGRSHLGWVST